MKKMLLWILALTALALVIGWWWRRRAAQREMEEEADEEVEELGKST